ncbi:MAG TPA: zinc-dependent peptidase [Bacteroidales bacterium]|nr:zinc-dependent peptidase [Bacteroidales bacterium]
MILRSADVIPEFTAMVILSANKDSLELIIFLLMIPVFIYRAIIDLETPMVKRHLKKYLFLRNLEKKYRPFLSRNFPFYNSLDQKEKGKFERRVQKFIDIKQFIPRGGLKEITAEMKAMIAACAVQMTYGYPDVYFRHFWRILIYPDNYYSSITHKYHKGEVNVRGLIVLSWNSFLDGFRYPNDGQNLGYHEMAHALRLINIVENEEYDFWDRGIMKKFEGEAKNETLKILNSKKGTSFFREYCLTNLDEFFAVAVENFFERPAALKEYNPVIYELLTKILKTDPAAVMAPSQAARMIS